MPLNNAAGSGAGRSSFFRLGWLAYLCFIAYGSLLPFDFHSRPMADALAAFRNLPLLQIGVEGRADLIANGVLYAPLGFLTAILFGRSRSLTFGLLMFVCALVFCGLFALAIEFAQLFFPPRTVSLNDVAAEGLGSLLGAALGSGCAGRFGSFLDAFSAHPKRLGLSLLAGYAIAYLLLSLFPYDFLLSSAEFEQKLKSGSWGFLLARDSLNAGKFMLLARTVAEILAIMPFGLLFGRRTTGNNVFFRGFVLGAGLGLCIELAQFFLFSGISQGLSIFTRAVGLGAGAQLWHSAPDIGDWRSLVRRHSPVLSVLYLLGLTGVSGWFGHHWGDIGLAAGKLGETRFIPFYYHYYTSESIALVSLTLVCLMYAPIGVLAWAMRVNPLLAALAAVLVAFVIEAAKLFHDGTHPDPTDVFLAAFIAWAAGRMMERVTGRATCLAPSTESEGIHPVSLRNDQGSAESLSLSATEIGPGQAAGGGRVPMDSGAWRGPSALGYAGLLVVVVTVGWGIAAFPFHPALLGLLLAGLGGLIWRYPPLLVAAIPAALPVLDLAPWSGHFYFDEFDFLILVCLAVGYVRVPPAPRPFGRDRFFLIIAALLGASYVIGCVRGLLPWQEPDANSFTNYYSPYNALRIFKGALWAFLLYALMHRLAASGQDIRRFFAWGMVIGLAGTVAVIVWERLTFPGLFNFSSDYRVTGPFSQLHTGGAYIEGFLTAAVPFLMLLLFQVRSLLARTAGVALLVGTTYALMVTFSRNGYAAFAVALTVFFAAALAELAQQRASLGLRRGAAVLTLMALALAVAMPVFKGEFIQARMSQVGNDLRVRENHWSDALRIRDQDLTTAIFGMGLGRYPETHYWRSTENNHSAAYRVETEGSNTFLRMGSGNAVYLEQFAGVEPRRNYLLSLDVRSHKQGSSITVPVCEKWLLTSYNCAWQSFELGQETDQWRHYEKRIDTSNMADAHWFARRPVRLTIYNSSSSAAVDIDNVRLASEDGSDLLRNGDFRHGLDHWFFSTDNHLPWHIKNMLLSILFDQGWFGVLAFGLLVSLAVGRASRKAWSGHVGAGAVLAALAGFLVVGIFDSLVDTPRFLLLFLLLLWFGNRSKTELSG